MPPAHFSDALAELQQVLALCGQIAHRVQAAGAAILHSLQKGGKLLTCGNGGSAADALHLSEELVGRYKLERRALPAICLSSDCTALTCIGNDYGYDQLFSRQIEALARPGDVLVGFSTSGNSKNVLRAFDAAKSLGVITVLLGGGTGGAAFGVCDHELLVPSRTTARIQEIHTLILHAWLESIDAHFAAVHQ